MKIDQYYVQHPVDKNWGTSFRNWVIIAEEIDISDCGLNEWQKTEAYARDYLKVVTKDYDPLFIKKESWIACKKARKEGLLSFHEYVKIVHDEKPELPIPKK